MDALSFDDDVCHNLVSLLSTREFGFVDEAFLDF